MIEFWVTKELGGELILDPAWKQAQTKRDKRYMDETGVEASGRGTMATADDEDGEEDEAESEDGDEDSENADESGNDGDDAGRY
jgi:hypothetical protein